MYRIHTTVSRKNRHGQKERERRRNKYKVMENSMAKVNNANNGKRKVNADQNDSAISKLKERRCRERVLEIEGKRQT